MLEEIEASQVRLKGLLVAYSVLAGVITGGCLLIFGWPDPADWVNSWLPALLGPALFVAAYAVIARFGQWRIERQIQSLED